MQAHCKRTNNLFSSLSNYKTTYSNMRSHLNVRHLTTIYKPLLAITKLPKIRTIEYEKLKVFFLRRTL
jgi:hypothetical protein